MGVDYYNTRVGKYIADLELLLEAIRTGEFSSLTGPQQYPQVVNSLYESSELINIYSGLHDYIVTKELRDKFRLFVKGPEFAIEEKPETGSQRARDIAFELYMASIFSIAGYRIDFNTDADLRFYDGNEVFFLECKRPRSANAVGRNVKSAASQLRKRYRDSATTRTFGVMSLSIDLVSNFQHDLLIVPNEQELDKYMRFDTRRFHITFGKNWKSIPDNQTLGVLLSLQRVAIPQELEIITSCSFVSTVKIDHSDFALAQRFDQIHKRLIPAIESLNGGDPTRRSPHHNGV